jgi:TetR/AcrR family transcriptional regulator, repressor for uid operon
LPAKLQEQRRQAARGWLLGVAAELFAKQGVDTSMAEIAASAGITTPALYHYFTSRRDLIQEAMVHAGSAFIDDIAAIDGDRPVVDQLQGLAHRHVESVEAAGPGAIRFLYWSILGAPRASGTSEAFDPIYEAAQSFFRGAIATGQKRGEIRDDVDAQVISELLTSCFAGIDIDFAGGRGSVPPERVFEVLLDMLTMYLAPAPKKRSERRS